MDETTRLVLTIFAGIFGLLIGVVAFKSRAVERVVQPTLDLMQTFPTFAYLIPILLLFGFGPVVGLIASAIYAMPPMVRNVMLGLSRVSDEVVESGTMSGATRSQLLWWVQVPRTRMRVRSAPAAWALGRMVSAGPSSMLRMSASAGSVGVVWSGMGRPVVSRAAMSIDRVDLPTLGLPSRTANFP